MPEPITDDQRDLVSEVREALSKATPGPWAVREINLGRIDNQEDVLWPWVFAVNPMPIPASLGATTGPLVADLSRRHEADPEDGLDYAHGGVASIETTDGVYRDRDLADAELIAHAPEWLAALCEHVERLTRESAHECEITDKAIARAEKAEAAVEQLSESSQRSRTTELQARSDLQTMTKRAMEAEAAVERVRALANQWYACSELAHRILTALDGE